MRECSVSRRSRSRSSVARPISRCWATARLVEGVGGARQLDLAVQRLVGDAQQRAVGHPQADSLGGDRAALHVDGDGARQVDAPPLLGVAQLPVAVVVGDDGAGAQALLQRLARLAGDDARPRPAARSAPRPAPGSARRAAPARRGCGPGADRRAPARSRRSAATARRPPQWPTISQQLRAQHREVVGDVLGVGRADADVDQGHALRRPRAIR